MEIREEQVGDQRAIFELNRAAFGRVEEARLVDQLRAHKAIIYSLVALDQGEVVGHTLYSPVLIQQPNGVVAVVAGLGPVAILPARQKQGIGSKLIAAGNDLCREEGYQLVIVLGHPAYYPRFGFRRAALFGIRPSFDAPEDAFMALELRPQAANGLDGVAHYHPAFAAV